MDNYALDNQGALQGYLEQNQNYMTVQGVQGQDQTVAASNGQTLSVPTVTLVPDPGTGQAQVPVQTPYAVPGVAAPYVPGQTVAPQQTPAQPTVSLAQFQAAAELARRNEQVAIAAERARMEAEENTFLMDVRGRLNAGLISEEEAKLEVAMRHIEQLTEANTVLAGEKENREQTEFQQQQARGKAVTGMTLALNAGLNWFDPQVQRIVMGASTRDEMLHLVGFLASQGAGRMVLPSQQRGQRGQPTAAQVAAGRFAVPDQGRPAAPPQQRSGDNLSGYLSTKSYSNYETP